MSTDQADTAAVFNEASGKKCDRLPLRDVNDFLADLDEVLSPSPSASQAPQPTAAEDTPAKHQKRGEKRWWDEVYWDNEADQDTFTGNAPAPVSAPSVPPQPTHAPNIPQDVEKDPEDVKDVKKGAPKADPPTKTAAGKKKARTKQLGGLPKNSASSGRGTVSERPTGYEDFGSVKQTGPLTRRGRRVFFAGTAAGIGYGLQLDHVPKFLMAHADQYATPVTAALLGASILCLSTRTRAGGVLFVSSLLGIAVLQMFDPAYVVGGGLAASFQAAYLLAKNWAGKYGGIWPWKGVLWLIHVPAATASLVVIQYGTN